jgi:hypothetical protein
VSSDLAFSLHQAGGLVLRSRGHRRYYAAAFTNGATVSILRRIDDAVTELAATAFTYVEDRLYHFSFAAQGSDLTLHIDGVQILRASDPDATLRAGGAGFLVERGTMLASGFTVRSAS